MSLVVRVPRDGCLQERAFIAEILLGDRLGLAYQLEPADIGQVEIRGEDGRSLEMVDRFFNAAASSWLDPATLPSRPLQYWPLEPGEIPGLPAGGSLPIIYGGNLGSGPLLSRSRRGTYLALDVFGSCFFMLTRYEEAAAPLRDWADRFPAEASLAKGEGFLTRPVVDEYVELLWRELALLWPGLVRRETRYSLRLSHDVDWPYATVGVPLGVSLRKLAGDVLVRRSPSLGLQRMRSLIARGEASYALDPNNTFDFIMDTSERNGHQSVFNFIAGHTAPGDMDGVYDLDQPWIRKLLRRCAERNQEVGIHPSFGTFRNGLALGAEFANLARAAAAEGIRQPSFGGRQHYLRWEASITWRLYQEAGLSYDSTLGYAESPGFRCGTCHPFRTYDLQGRRALPLVERPMVVMDVTLMGGQYMKVSPAQAMDLIQGLVDQCRAYRGEFVLLWHNSNLLTADDRHFYQELVQSAG
jgi:hypothetical protein